MPEYEFSVWVFLRDGYHFPIVQQADARQAVTAAHRATKVPGRAERIIITDGDDFCCFEWQRGKGVTFPPPSVGGKE